MEDEAFLFSTLPLTLQDQVVTVACQQLGQTYQYGVLPCVSRRCHTAAKITWTSVTLGEHQLTEKDGEAGEQLAAWVRKYGSRLAHFSVRPTIGQTALEQSSSLVHSLIPHHDRLRKAVATMQTSLAQSAVQLCSLDHNHACAQPLDLSLLPPLTNLTSLRA
jgi:hypothetical protein